MVKSGPTIYTPKPMYLVLIAMVLHDGCVVDVVYLFIDDLDDLDELPVDREAS